MDAEKVLDFVLKRLQPLQDDIAALQVRIGSALQTVAHHTHDAADIVSGVLAVARLPIIPKTLGGLGIDVSQGLTNGYIAKVAGGALVIGPPDVPTRAPKTAELFQWQAPGAANPTALVDTYAGTDPDTYAGTIHQPDVPRSLSITWSNDWTGGDLTLTYTFDGQSNTATYSPAPGSTVQYQDLVTQLVSVKKAAAGTGSASIGVGSLLGAETGGHDLETFGMGMVDDAASPVHNDVRTDGKAVDFSSMAPNGSRTFKFVANVL